MVLRKEGVLTLDFSVERMLGKSSQSKVILLEDGATFQEGGGIPRLGRVDLDERLSKEGMGLVEASSTKSYAPCWAARPDIELLK